MKSITVRITDEAIAKLNTGIRLSAINGGDTLPTTLFTRLVLEAIEAGHDTKTIRTRKDTEE